MNDVILSAKVYGLQADIVGPDGRVQTVLASSGDDIRRVVIAYGVSFAGEQGHAITMLTSGDRGEHSFLIEPDGIVSALVSDTAASLATDDPAAELQVSDRASARKVLTAPMPRHQRISVLSAKAETGTTATAAMVAATIGYYRGGGVAVWENQPSLGALSTRSAPGGYPFTERELLAALSGSPDRAAVRGYLHHQPDDRYDVLRGGAGALSSEKVDRALIALEEAYVFTVLDLRPVMDERYIRSVANSTALIVTTGSSDADITATSELMAFLETRSDALKRLAQSAAIVVSGGKKHPRPQMAKLHEQLETESRKIVSIPTDPAFNNYSLSYQSLRARTRDALLDLVLASVSPALVSA